MKDSTKKFSTKGWGRGWLQNDLSRGAVYYKKRISYHNHSPDQMAGKGSSRVITSCMQPAFKRDKSHDCNFLISEKKVSLLKWESYKPDVLR